MTTPRADSMKAMKSARIVLLADGDVGQQIARIAIEHDPRLVCGLVSLPETTPCGRLARDHSIAHVEYDANDLGKTAQAIRSLGANIVLLVWWPLILSGTCLHWGRT